MSPSHEDNDYYRQGIEDAIDIASARVDQKPIHRAKEIKRASMMFRAPPGSKNVTITQQKTKPQRVTVKQRARRRAVSGMPGSRRMWWSELPKQYGDIWHSRLNVTTRQEQPSPPCLTEPWPAI